VSNKSFRSDERTTPRGQVLAALRDGEGLTRAELSALTDLSGTTITRVVTQLITEGLIVEGEAVSRHPTGRPGTSLAMVASSTHVVGIGIGVGTVTLAVADVLCRLGARAQLDYALDETAASVLGRISTATQHLLASVSVPEAHVRGVGVAVPGPVDVDQRRLLMPTNLPWSDVAVADALESRLGMPVVVEHNVRSMALAAFSWGGTTGNVVAFVYLRTGLGAGLVVDGQPFQGGVRGAIELGHLHIADTGVRCACGGVGCLETVVSDAALRRFLASIGQDPGMMTPLAALLTTAEAGHPGALAQAERIVQHLSVGLSALVNLLAPDVILLGGALGSVPDWFLARLQDSTDAVTFPLIRGAVRLQRSALGDDAAVKGAASVALDRLVYSGAPAPARTRSRLWGASALAGPSPQSRAPRPPSQLSHHS